MSEIKYWLKWWIKAIFTLFRFTLGVIVGLCCVLIMIIIIPLMPYWFKEGSKIYKFIFYMWCTVDKLTGELME